jgi:predicted HTH domain antitoxin
MSRITLDSPDDALAALKLPANEASDAVRLAAAAKLYEMGRLSTGAAARLAGVPRPVFLTKLADYGVDTFVLNREDLEDETRFA